MIGKSTPINLNLKKLINMKTLKFLLLTTAIISSVNCSSTTKTTADNSNTGIVQNVAVPTATPPTAADGKATQTTTSAPDALIKDLYKTHDKDYGAVVQGKNRQILDKYFNKNLADLIWKDETTNNGELGVIDFDIFYNAQDSEIKSFAVGSPKITGDKATVPVTFTNFGEKKSLTYLLVKEKEAWKISDINYGGNNSLLTYFKADEEANQKTGNESQTGEFEGKYQIGDTTCLVKPVKMAFEVKWAKGSGTEMFFSEGRANDKLIFASSPPKGKANSFSFDDENYNTGIFYRADGKEFLINRIK